MSFNAMSSKLPHSNICSFSHDNSTTTGLLLQSEAYKWAEFVGSELSGREMIAFIWRQVGSLHALLSVAYTLDWWPSVNNHFVFWESESFSQLIVLAGFYCQCLIRA